MEVDTSDESYIIAQAQKLRSSDQYAAKAWVITAKTLFPKNFNVQFEAYKLEKESNNFEEAAKCFSYMYGKAKTHVGQEEQFDIFIVLCAKYYKYVKLFAQSTINISNCSSWPTTLTFQNQNVELWNEVNELTNALRAPENEITPAQEFYVKMFQHVSADVQHKILLLTVNRSENSLNQCKLLLLILRRFPQAAVTHSPRLLEMIADGMKQNPQKYQEMLVVEALPLIYHKTPELSPGLVCRLFTISLEYYIRQIIDDEATKCCDTNETWKKIFQVLMMCGKILHWETFLPFNKTWGQNVYWDKLIEIVSNSPAGSTQVLFYAMTLFIYSLHCYIKNCNTRADETEMNHVLVEGFTEERSDALSMGPPHISPTTPASKEISKAFVNAAQCWQLLNTDQFQRDFSKLLLTLPLAPWISRFLFDLAIYFGHQEEAKKLMAEMTVKSSLVHNIQILSLNLLQGSLTLQGFECIGKILAELPTTQGQVLEHLTREVPRHMIFIPLTQKALVQYCTKAIVNNLSRKLYEPNCPDQILGDLLVLLQLEYPRETLMAEQIFSLITSRRSFTYRMLSSYIVTIDFIEEFMHIWHSHNEDFNFDFAPAQSTGGLSTRRIGTRGADKGVREDFRLIIKQQISRANENLTTLIGSFITQEHSQLMQNIFGAEESGF